MHTRDLFMTKFAWLNCYAFASHANYCGYFQSHFQIVIFFYIFQSNNLIDFISKINFILRSFFYFIKNNSNECVECSKLLKKCELCSNLEFFSEEIYFHKMFTMCYAFLVDFFRLETGAEPNIVGNIAI